MHACICPRFKRRCCPPGSGPKIIWRYARSTILPGRTQTDQTCRLQTQINTLAKYKSKPNNIQPMTMGRRRKHTHTDLDTLRPQNKNQQCCTEAGKNEMNVNMLKIFADMIASMLCVLFVYVLCCCVLCVWYGCGMCVVFVRILLWYGRGLVVFCVWYVCGIVAVCLWYVCGMAQRRKRFTNLYLNNYNE